MVAENPNHAIAAFVASLPKGAKGEATAVAVEPTMSEAVGEWNFFLFLFMIFVLGMAVGFLLAKCTNKITDIPMAETEDAGITPMPLAATSTMTNRRPGGPNISFKHFKRMTIATTGDRIHFSSACAGPTNKRTYEACRRCFVPRLGETCLDCGLIFDRCTCD